MLYLVFAQPLQWKNLEKSLVSNCCLNITDILDSVFFLNSENTLNSQCVQASSLLQFKPKYQILKCKNNLKSHYIKTDSFTLSALGLNKRYLFPIWNILQSEILTSHCIFIFLKNLNFGRHLFLMSNRKNLERKKFKSKKK